MPSNCEDVTAQMMELLYGELPADARARVDAHVAGCARCRAELDGFEKTRALARTGLDEAPPARARAAIMQAAAAHLAAAQAQGQPAAARRPAAPEKESFWERLRARWTFPTLATLGAVAVFMVANRVFLNPERTLAPRPAAETPVVSSTREPALVDRPQGIDEPPEPKEERPGAGSDQAAGPRGAGSRAHHAKGGDARREIAERPAIQGGGRADEKAKRERDEPSENRFAPPPPPRDGTPAGSSAKAWADKAVMPREQAAAPAAGVVAARPSSPARKPTPARVAASPQAEGSLDDLMGDSPGPRAGGGIASGKNAVGGLAGPRSKSESYGSGAAAAQPAPVASRATTNEMRRQAPVVAAAPAASPPPPALTKSRAKKSDVGADEMNEGGAQATAAKDEKKVVANHSADDALMLRADRLFADGRWAEAAAVYRELLRRAPRSDDAERWRRRLIAAENADVNEKRNASVAAQRAAAAQKAEAESAAKPPARAPAKASKAAATDVAQ